MGLGNNARCHVALQSTPLHATWQGVHGKVYMARCDVLYCLDYFPSFGSLRTVWDVQITLLSEHEYCDDYIVRNFSLRNTQTSEVHDVTQFHYLSWPAELPSVPESHRALLEFRR